MGLTYVEGREGSVSGQRATLSGDADTTASADPVGSSGARMAFQGCAQLRRTHPKLG